MSAQIAVYPSAEYKTQAPFAFLSQPPPRPQKKRPTANTPLPGPPAGPLPQIPVLHRRRSSTFSSIVAWASHVQPGSPAPRSPRRRSSITSTTSSVPRRPSISRRPSIARLNLNRRPSISHGRAPSGSFSHIIDAQSTPSVANFDLTAHGYTTLFVHLPKTPTTPSPLLRKYNQAGVPKTPVSPVAVPLSASFATPNIPVPPIPQDKKRTGMKRFRSLSILRPKSSKAKPQVQVLGSPTKPSTSTQTFKATATSPTSKSTSTAYSKHIKAEIRSAHIAQRKRAKYAYVRPPPPLANELAMMQFADGGSLEANVKRVMEAQAKMAKGSGSADVGISDVYRDGNGGIWWDADEELEYAHLLDGANQAGVGSTEKMDVDDNTDMDWEEFDAAEPMAAAAAAAAAPTKGKLGDVFATTSNKENLLPVLTATRRPSLSLSLSSADSDLDPQYLLPLPENEDPRLLPIDDRVLASARIHTGGEPSMGALLSLPARPRRRAKHLCKAGFLVVDGSAWGVTSTAHNNFDNNFDIARCGVKVKGPTTKSRRRPAPLKLAGLDHANANVHVSSTVAQGVVSPHIVSRLLSPGGIGTEKTRKEFIDDSFAPSVERLRPDPSPGCVSETLPSSAAASAAAAAAVLIPASKPNRPFRMRGFSFFTSSASRRGD